MDKTDPTIDRVTTPYTLTKQLRLLMRDRDTEIATIGVRGEMMSRGYLESLDDYTLIRTRDETIQSINDIRATLIMDIVSRSGHKRIDIGDTAEQQCRLLQDARRYIEQTGIEYEIAILRRIASDVIDILDMRGGSGN